MMKHEVLQGYEIICSVFIIQIYLITFLILVIVCLLAFISKVSIGLSVMQTFFTCFI